MYISTVRFRFICNFVFAYYAFRYATIFCAIDYTCVPAIRLRLLV